MTQRIFVDDGEQSSTPPTPRDTVAVRPKIMRRPATFAAPAAKDVPPTASPITPAAPPQSTTANARLLWHEDARFGLMLILALLMLNMLLGVLIPYLPIATRGEEKSAGVVLFGSAAMPNAVRQDAARVSSYTDPQSGQRLQGQFDLNQVDPQQNALSVSPRDTPPPRARSLDNTTQ